MVKSDQEALSDKSEEKKSSPPEETDDFADIDKSKSSSFHNL